MGGQCQKGSGCCNPPAIALKTRHVEFLGARELSRDPDAAQEAAPAQDGGRFNLPGLRQLNLIHHGGFKHQVMCPEGHVMRAKVVREMFLQCYQERECDTCGVLCESDSSHYRCSECDIVYCNSCARSTLGLKEITERGEALEVHIGDILLAGPDKFGIHHVILVRSGWKEADPDVVELLDVEPGADILCCDTIESTQGSVGTETWWYPTTTYFTRRHEDGALFLVADLPADSEVLEQAKDPVRTKLMLHPFRPENGGPEMDEAAFRDVIRSAAARSVRYGKRTAVKSVISGLLHQDHINASSYATEEARGQLAKKLKESWKARPICASVAVMCWQQYFFKAHPDRDEAVQHVIDYMPHWCHKSTPSALVNSLTQHGWIISDVADE